LYYALLILLNFSPAWLAAGLGLTLYMGAFLHRDLSIGRGQWQAGRALGFQVPAES
jgi:polar amino acid transport system permease protein